MTDLADLGLRIHSEDVEVANQRLDDLAGKSTKAEKATDSMAKATKSAMSDLLAAIIAATGSIDRNTAAMIEAAAAAGKHAGAAGVLSAALDEQAAASTATAAATTALGTAQTAQASASRTANSAAKDMADAIEAEEAALKKATTEVKRATVSYGDFYDQANRNFATQYVRQLDQVGTAHGKAAKAAGLQGHELMSLGRQFADIFTQLGSGQNPFTILIQQGPQIADVFATAATRGVGFKAVLAEIGAMVAPFAALAAAVLAVGAAIGIVAVASWQAAKAHEAASIALLGAGRASGMTADEVTRLADAQAKAGDISVSSARTMANELLALGVVNQDVMGRAIAVQRDFALVMGLDSKDAAEQLAKALADPAKGIEDLDRKLNLFDDTTKEYLLSLAKQNDLTASQQGLLAALEGQLGTATDKVDALSNAWHRVQVQSSIAMAKMGEVLNLFESNRDRQIERIQGRLNNPVLSLMYSADEKRQMQAGLEALKADKARETAAAAATKAQAENNRETKFYGEIVRGLNPIEEQRSKILKDMANVRAGMAKGMVKEAEGAKALAYAQVQLKALDKREAGPAAKIDPSVRRAQNLAREADAMEATIKGNMALAAAYAVSDQAALKQIATTKATAQAIQKQGDIEAFVARQIRLNVSEQAVSGAKRLADVEAETAALGALNKRVAAGEITSTEANRLAKEEAALRPLNAAYALAEGEAKAQLKAIIDGLATAQKASNAAQIEAANLRALEEQGRTLEFLSAQVGLIGAGNTQRAVELAQLREKQTILAAGGDPTTGSGRERVNRAGDIARQQAALSIGQTLYNESLDATLDRLQQIESLVSSSTGGLADAFDGMSAGAAKFTRALGGMLSAINKVAITEEKINRSRADSLKRVNDAWDTGDINKWLDATEQHDRVLTKTAREMADAQVGAYADMAGAAKGFFEEGSTGYKVMQAAEIAFRAVQFAMSVQAMAQNATETAASVANSGTKATASVTAGAARMFEEGGWFGFVGVAAMLAVMASLGFSGGSGGAKPGYDLEAVQARQGTGSVLGDASAKSESIANSLELVAEHTNNQLEYSNLMLRALRGIESSMGNVAAAIARSLSVGGALDPGNVKTGSQTINHSFMGPGTNSNADPFVTFGILGGLPDFLGLHNTTISKKLVDSGIQFVGQTLGDIMAGGIDAAFYQTVQTRTQKKAFGFTYSDKTKTKTVTSAVDEDLARQLSLIVGGLRDGILAAANVLGVDGAGAVLDAFKLNLGNISFKDMKASEIEEALNAVFSKLGDDMAGAVLPGLTSLQKAGEGLFETLMRVARQYQIVDVTLASVGLTFGAVGVSSLAARERLVNLFGSLDDFTDQVSFYSENFLTEAERLAPVQAALTKELARLGISGLDTRDEFKALVQSLDLSTEAGAEMFAALMAIAPAFAAITEETQAIADQRDRLSSAYERESGALADTKARFQDLAKSLGEFRATLYSGPAAALSPEAQYLASKAEFQRVAGLAAQGNEQALGDLQNVSQEYLDASRAYFASSQGYFTDLAAVREAVTAAEGMANTQVDVATQQLDTLKALVDPVLNIDDNIGTVAEELAALNALIGAGNTNTPVIINGAVPASNDNSDVLEAITETNSQLEETNKQLRAQIDQQAAISARTEERLAASEAELTRIRQALTERNVA